MSHSCFIYSSTDGHLGCLHILATVNNAAMNIGVFMFFRINVLGFFRYMPRSGISGSKGRSIFNFWRICTLFSTVAAPICTPINSTKGFLFLHILTSTCRLLIWWQPFWLVWGHISLWFLLAFLWWLVTLSIFSYVYWSSVCPLEKIF